MQRINGIGQVWRGGKSEGRMRQAAPSASPNSQAAEAEREVSRLKAEAEVASHRARAEVEAAELKGRREAEEERDRALRELKARESALKEEREVVQRHAVSAQMLSDLSGKVDAAAAKAVEREERVAKAIDRNLQVGHRPPPPQPSSRPKL